MNHLTPQAIEWLSLPLEERVEKALAPRWIGYPRAQAILVKYSNLLSRRPIGRTPCILLCGDSNAGKSMLMNHFTQAKNKVPVGSTDLPVVIVQAPVTPNPKDFYSICLDSLNTPHRSSDRAEALRAQLSLILRGLKTRMLVIDEVHHMLAGSARSQRAFLNMLKYLVNDLQIPIIALGTRDALHAFQMDPQIANRFEPILLPRWEYCDDYLRLLASFEVSTPLREPSNLAAEAIARKLLVMSEGLIGELATIIGRAAEHAIRSGHELIDAGVLGAIEWIPPRKRQGSALEVLAREVI